MSMMSKVTSVMMISVLFMVMFIVMSVMPLMIVLSVMSMVNDVHIVFDFSGDRDSEMVYIMSFMTMMSAMHMTAMMTVIRFVLRRAVA